MFVCGLCMEICLDVVVNEMNLDILERECLVQRIGILMSEFDARMTGSSRLVPTRVDSTLVAAEPKIVPTETEQTQP